MWFLILTYIKSVFWTFFKLKGIKVFNLPVGDNTLILSAFLKPNYD